MHPRFRIRRFLKGFTLNGHCGQLGQMTAIVLAIFRFPNLRSFYVKFEQHWIRVSEKEVVC